MTQFRDKRTEMTRQTVETSIKGKWREIPGLAIDGVTVVVRGKWLKMAIIHNEQWLTNALDNPENVVRGLKDSRWPGLRADIFTFAQRPSDALPKYKYATEWESVAAVHVTTFQDWWGGLPQETRKNVRRSTKRGVEVRLRELDDDLIKGIAEVNNESPVRQRIPNVHYGKSIEEVRKDQSSYLDRSYFICAYVGAELVGVMKLVQLNDAAAILQFHLKPSHNDKRLGNALLAKAVELCAEKRLGYLIYGLFNYANKRESPLRDFKVRNGFNEILVPRYYVPLTVWGAICLKLKLHRGILGILPNRVIRLLVDVRAKWYGLRQSISRCSLVLERSKSNRQTECSIPPAGSNV